MEDGAVFVGDRQYPVSGGRDRAFCQRTADDAGQHAGGKRSGKARFAGNAPEGRCGDCLPGDRRPEGDRVSKGIHLSSGAFRVGRGVKRDPAP